MLVSVVARYIYKYLPVQLHHSILEIELNYIVLSLALLGLRDMNCQSLLAVCLITLALFWK